MSPEERSGAFETEEIFRERLLHSLAQWQQWLAGGGASAPQAIAREVTDLRAMAQTRGWSAAQHLTYLESIAQKSPATLSQALTTIGNLLRVANVPVSAHTVPLAQAIQRSAASPLPVAVSHPSARPVAPPASPLPSPEGGPIAPPPLIGSSLWAPSPLAASADALPESQVKPRPPKLLRSILGLSAAWKKRETLDKAPGAVRPSGGRVNVSAKGLFGFRSLTSEAARPIPSPIPGRLGFDSNRPRSWRKSESSASWRRVRPPHSGKSGLTSEPAVPRWFYLLIGLVGLLGVATICTIAAMRLKGPAPVASAVEMPTVTTTTTTSSSGKSSQAESVGPDVHKLGKETDRLRMLLDSQRTAAARCLDDPASCGGEKSWTANAMKSMTTSEAADLVPLSRDTQLPSWIKSARVRNLPSDLTLRDEPVLHQLFWNFTHSQGGHDSWTSKQNVQDMLYKCAAYSAIFDEKFGFYHVPGWLSAVVFQESQCNPVVESPAHAKGLWQFMEETARIYGLYVKEGQIDERLNPEKSTDAAVRFLSDLHDKFGAWDLSLAAYNAGPYAVAAPLARLGDKFGFWDLFHAHLLPKETAGYVPAIEAYALVIENSSQWFSPDGKRALRTMAVNVKPGIRLSLIARAARTSTKRIRELNLEFLSDHVPEVATTALVPEEEASGAQAFLDKWAPEDKKDQCVPDDFDWGLKQFEHSEYAKCAER
jgi:Transglycosylase SLT domain